MHTVDIPLVPGAAFIVKLIGKRQLFNPEGLGISKGWSFFQPCMIIPLIKSGHQLKASYRMLKNYAGIVTKNMLGGVFHM